MTSSPLPFPWKVVVAAAVIAVLIVGMMETRRRWPKAKPPDPEPGAQTTSGLYLDTLARIQDIIAVYTSSVPEVVTPGMKLTDLGVDLSTRMDVAEALESADHIELLNQELAQLETVDDLVRLVVKKQQEGNVRAKLP